MSTTIKLKAPSGVSEIFIDSVQYDVVEGEINCPVSQVNNLLSAGWTYGNFVVGDVDVDSIDVKYVYWDGIASLQTVLDAITDAAATKPYTIMIPPGQFTIGAILLKPWVNLKGAGGRGRMSIFKSGTLGLLDAAISTGIHRFRMDGIRMETCPVTFTCTTNGKTLLVVMDDCPCNSASPIVTLGETYGAATTMVNLELRNMNIDCNTTAQKFKLARVSFWQVTCLGLYFKNSDAYFFGCDISAACNVVNDAASTGGWFEFNGCKIDRMASNSPTSESTIKTLCASDNENVQIHGNFCGYTAPASISYWGRIQPGAMYFCSTDSKLYVKTGAVGTNTWTAQT